MGYRSVTPGKTPRHVPRVGAQQRPATMVFDEGVPKFLQQPLKSKGPSLECCLRGRVARDS